MFRDLKKFGNHWLIRDWRQLDISKFNSEMATFLSLSSDYRQHYINDNWTTQVSDDSFITTKKTKKNCVEFNNLEIKNNSIHNILSFAMVPAMFILLHASVFKQKMFLARLSLKWKWKSNCFSHFYDWGGERERENFSQPKQM